MMPNKSVQRFCKPQTNLQRRDLSKQALLSYPEVHSACHGPPAPANHLSSSPRARDTGGKVRPFWCACVMFLVFVGCCKENRKDGSGSGPTSTNNDLKVQVFTVDEVNNLSIKQLTLAPIECDWQWIERKHNYWPMDRLPSQVTHYLSLRELLFQVLRTCKCKSSHTWYFTTL